MILDWSYSYHDNNMYQQAAPVEICFIKRQPTKTNKQTTTKTHFICSYQTTVYVCVCIPTENLFHLIYISYSQDHIYTHMLTHSYSLNDVYLHDDTQNILYRISRLLPNKFNLAATQTSIDPKLYIL